MAKHTVRRYLKLLAPGTPLRAGLDRILLGHTGALVVLGNNPQVQALSSGGFQLDVDFTEQALRELAKMDGAIVLSNDMQRIMAAGVQLMPDRSLVTAETGTRHRSADLTAQAAAVPVVTVSASMGVISLSMDGRRHLVETVPQVISRANQTLATLSRFVTRLNELLAQFTALEVAEQVTLRDLVQLIHRLEMTRRLSSEMLFHADVLGVEGRLVAMQHAELAQNFEGLAELLTDDYAHNLSDPLEFQLDHLHNFSSEELLSSQLVASRLGFGNNPNLETQLATKGQRLLLKVGLLPQSLAARLSEHFTLQELFGASPSQLMELDGIGPQRARLVRDAMLRIADSAYTRADAP